MPKLGSSEMKLRGQALLPSATEIAYEVGVAIHVVETYGSVLSGGLSSGSGSRSMGLQEAIRQLDPLTDEIESVIEIISLRAL